MKKIQIGDRELSVCRQKSDINIMRWTAFKQYAPMMWEKMDSPTFFATMEKVRDKFNENDYWGAMIELQNYQTSIKNIEGGHDAWEMCFALITLEEGEDPTDISEESLMRKIQRLSSEGLTAEVVYREVENFMKASPETFSAQLVMLEVYGALKNSGDKEN